MADVRSVQGTPSVSAFGGVTTPSPSTPLIIDETNNLLYALINGIVTNVPSITLPSYGNAEVPTGTINSSNTVFTLAHAPSPAASLMLFLNGMLQSVTDDFTLSTNTITYVSAPQTGDTHICWYRY